MTDYWGIIVGLIVGVALGAAGAHEALRPTIRFLRDELAYYRKQLEISQDRLVHAHLVDKAIVPPRPVEPKPLVPLPAVLQESVNEWENPETRANLEARFRRQLDAGMQPMAILKDLENGALT